MHMNNERFKPVAIADKYSRTLMLIKPKALVQMGQGNPVAGRYYLPGTTLDTFDRKGLKFFIKTVDVWPRLEYTGDMTLRIYDWPFQEPFYGFGTGASPTAKARLDGTRFRVMPWTVVLCMLVTVIGFVFGYLFLDLVVNGPPEGSVSMGILPYVLLLIISTFMFSYAYVIIYRWIAQRKLLRAFVDKQALLAEY